MNTHHSPLNDTTGHDFLQDVVTRLRNDVHKVSDLRGEALSGVARSLNSLKTSLEHYETHRQKTWQTYIEEKAHGK